MIALGWKLVPIEPDYEMTMAFASEIRRQAGKLEPGTTQHEPLEPLWAAVLDAAPEAPRIDVPRSGADGWNAGLKALADVAQASADALRARLTEAPTRFCYAIEALDALVEAAAVLSIPPDEPGPTAPAAPAKPLPSLSGTEAVRVSA